MKNIILAIVSTAAILSVLPASAQYGRGGRGPGYGGPGYGGPGYGGHRDRIVLNYYDQAFRGQNTLYIKQKIRQQYPRLSPRHLQIERVVLVAKSRHGRGQASALIGGRESRSENVFGNPQDFHHDVPYTFSRIPFHNYSYNAQGPLQIYLRGNIKVRKVVAMAVRVAQVDLAVVVVATSTHY